MAQFLNTKNISPRGQRVLYTVQILISILGILLCLYLLVQHTRLISGIQETQSFCSWGKLADCDVVNASQYSEVLGFPLAGIGALFFFLCLVLGLMSKPAQPGIRFFQRLITLLCALAFFGDLVLFLIQIFLLETLCVFCLLSYLFCLIILTTSVAFVSEYGNFYSKMKHALSVTGEDWRIPRLPTRTWGLAILALISFCLAVFFVPSYIRTQSHSYSYVEAAMQKFYLEWKDLPHKKIEWKGDVGTFGNPSARVKIVEFSDFQCPHCRRAAFTLHTVLKPLSNRIFFVFKHFPLDSQCNPSVPYQLHPLACELAKLSICAAKKGQFWEFHDFLFFKLDDSSKIPHLNDIARKLPHLFSENDISQCLKNATASAHISSDIQSGNALDIKGTPSIFINGKLVTIPLTVESLRRLIEIEESL